MLKWMFKDFFNTWIPSFWLTYLLNEQKNDYTIFFFIFNLENLVETLGDSLIRRISI